MDWLATASLGRHSLPNNEQHGEERRERASPDAVIEEARPDYVVAVEPTMPMRETATGAMAQSTRSPPPPWLSVLTLTTKFSHSFVLPRGEDILPSTHPPRHPIGMFKRGVCAVRSWRRCSAAWQKLCRRLTLFILRKKGLSPMPGLGRRPIRSMVGP